MVLPCAREHPQQNPPELPCYSSLDRQKTTPCQMTAFKSNTYQFGGRLGSLKPRPRPRSSGAFGSKTSCAQQWFPSNESNQCPGLCGSLDPSGTPEASPNAQALRLIRLTSQNHWLRSGTTPAHVCGSHSQEVSPYHFNLIAWQKYLCYYCHLVGREDAVW